MGKRAQCESTITIRESAPVRKISGDVPDGCDASRMGSGEAKKFRDLYGSAGRHGQSFWEEEKDNVGMKLLKNMGWTHGQGLGKDGKGCTDAVKQFRKKDNAGIGSKAGTRDEAFKASQELFNDVLARLAGGSTDPGDVVEESAKLGSAAQSVKGVLARRQMARRFCRSQVIDH